MDVHLLVDMANQIGRFYAAGPDRKQALLDAATHLRRYWDPRMRRALYQHLDEHHGEGLDAFAAEAARLHRELLEPADAAIRK